MGQHRHDNMVQGAKVGEDVEGGKEVAEAVEVNPWACAEQRREAGWTAAGDAERVLPRVVTDVTATRSDATPTPSSTFNFQSAALASLWRVVPPHPQQLYVLPTS